MLLGVQSTSLASELAGLDAVAQAELVAARELKPVEVVEAAIHRIEALNPTLNAVITTAYDEALDTARGLTADTARPYAGVPFLLKDLIVEAKGMIRVKVGAQTTKTPRRSSFQPPDAQLPPSRCTVEPVTNFDMSPAR